MSRSSNSTNSSNSSDGTIHSTGSVVVSSPTSSYSSSSSLQLPQWRDAVAGAGAGAISRTIMAPIERIKLLQQLQYSTIYTTGSTSTGSTNSGTYRVMNSDIHRLSALQIALKIYKEEGIMSFWRGNLPNILRVAGTQALNFTCMDYYKRVAVTPMMEHWWFITSSSSTSKSSSVSSPTLQQQRQRRYSSILTSFISGGLAGATATTVLYPFEFVRTRLAMDRGKDRTSSHSTTTSTTATTTTTTNSTTTAMKHSNHHRRQYTGMVDVVRHILLKSSDGIFGFYQGYGVALVGGIIYRILYLGGYDASKTELLHYRRTKIALEQQNQEEKVGLPVELSWTERFVMAQMIALLAGTMTYPFDSVRRRMMMQAGIPKVQRLYTNSIHCTIQIWRKEGIRGFYLGLGPNLVRSVGGALILVGYDGIRQYL